MPEQSRKKFWTRARRIWLAAGLLMVAVVSGWVWLPGLGLRYGLVRTLTDLGWTNVSVLQADVSLLNGAVVIHRLRAGEDNDGVLGIDDLDVDFNWRPLFSRRVSLSRLDLSGVSLAVRRDETGLVINGLPLPGGDGGGDPSRWSYDVGQVTLRDSQLTYEDGKFKADIQVNALTLTDLRSWEPENPASFHLDGSLNGSPIIIDGTAKPFTDYPEFAAHITLQGLDTAAFADLLRRADAGALTGRLDAQVDLTGGLATDTPQVLSGDLSLHGGGWTLDGMTIAAGDLNAKGAKVSWHQGLLSAAGSLTGKDLSLSDGGLVSRVEQARLEIGSAVYESKTRQLTWDGSLNAQRHTVTVADTRIEHTTLDWRGSTRIDLRDDAQSFVHAEGKATVAGIRVAMAGMDLAAKTIQAQGVFEHARPKGVLPPLAGHFDAIADEVQVSEGEMDWLNVGHLVLTGLRLDPGRQAGLERAEAQRLSALAKRGKDRYRWRFEAGRAVLEQASINPDGAGSARTLEVDSAILRVVQTKTGIQGLPSGGAGGSGDPMPAQRLGQLRLTGDSRIDFVDRTPSEPVRLSMTGVTATVGDLDTGRPAQESPFTIQARVGAASIALNGTIQPFAGVPGGAVKGTVHALDLPVLSPYAADSLGVFLQTGQLDAEIDLAATKGQLDGGLQLTLSQLYVGQTEAKPRAAQPLQPGPLPAGEEGKAASSMPVETVLDLLRDSENRIRLSIPVRGNLSNPDFDFSDAVGQAVGGALRNTVFTTLKVAFPLAGLFSLVFDDGDNRRLALEPLAFAPGEDQLSDHAKTRLTEIARLMGQRATVNLNLCGAASEAVDWPVLLERRRNSVLGRLQALVDPASQPSDAPDRDRLGRLADARAQAARSYMADRGIDPGRLFTCRARVESGADSQPRVDLLL